MGGYGAFKWALRQPDRFAAAASLSGALDMARRGEPGRRNADPEVVDRVFGNRTVAGTGDDLFWLLHQADRSSTSLPASLPALYMCCGTEDVLYQENLTFRDACRDRNIGVTVDFGPGQHEWGYWDVKIQDVLAWLPIARPAS
jgi:putative tributyrin esterase